MDYFEPLPENCPIDKAKDQAVGIAYRIVSQDPPTEHDFLSKSSLGFDCPETDDPCRHASCSMFKNKSQILNIAKKLPKTIVPTPHISTCEIRVGHGMTYINKKKHVDFWAYAGFLPEHIVLNTVSVDLAEQEP